MKGKVYNLFLILSSLVGYLEWGANNESFLFQAEYEIFLKFLSSPSDLLHPLIILPFIGQVLLLITLFQKRTSKVISYIAIFCLSLLFALIIFKGAWNLNYKMLFFTTPFIICSLLSFIYHKNRA